MNHLYSVFWNGCTAKRTENREKKTQAQNEVNNKENAKTNHKNHNKLHKVHGEVCRVVGCASVGKEWVCAGVCVVAKVCVGSVMCVCLGVRV